MLFATFTFTFILHSRRCLCIKYYRINEAEIFLPAIAIDPIRLNADNVAFLLSVLAYLIICFYRDADSPRYRVPSAVLSSPSMSLSASTSSLLRYTSPLIGNYFMPRKSICPRERSFP